MGCPGNRVSCAPLAVMRPVGMGLRSDALGAVATQEIVCSPRVRKDEGGGAVCGVLGMWAGVGVMGAAVRPATVLGGSAGFSCGLPRGHSRGYEVVSVVFHSTCGKAGEGAAGSLTPGLRGGRALSRGGPWDTTEDMRLCRAWICRGVGCCCRAVTCAGAAVPVVVTPVHVSWCTRTAPFFYTPN